MANRRFIDFPIASTVGDNDIVLIWQDGANKQTTKATILSGLPENLEDLNDVVISGLTNGQILRYDSVTGKWENTDQGNLDLNDLNDVSIVSPSNGQVLVYNSSTSKWENSSGGFVPYVGAVTTVDLGAQGLRAGYVRFDTSVASVPDEQGLMYWDASRSTAALIMNGTLQHIGQDTFFYVKNSSGSNIPKGTCVRFAGTDGASGHLLIAPFLANGSVQSSYFMGVTAEAIANGSFGQVMHFGELEGINTSGFTAGALLYASTTVAGGFQTTVPVAPNNIVLVAAAVNSKNNGAIIVRPQIGSNINNDEGVKITSPTTGDLLQLQAGGLWENKTLAQVIGSAYVPSTRTLTINGTTQDLSANRTYNVGTVTSVGLSSATSGVTIGSTPVTTSGTITLAIATASGSQNGLLSSTDWTTFNNKQNALTNPVTGTGASGQVAYFNGTTTITSESNLFWDATNDRLGIGTSSPTDRLTLHRDGATGVYAHWRNNSNANNAYIGITGSGLMQIQNNGNIDFYTGASYNNQMTLAGTGNLIIGNPGADNGARLQVSGTATLTNLLVGTSATQNGRATIATSSDEYLDIVNTTEVNTKATGIRFGNYSVTDGFKKAGIFYQSVGDGASRGDLIIALNTAFNANNVTPANAVMTFKGTSGNVGIGTSSPAANLQVASSSSPVIAMNLTGSATSGPRGDLAWYNSSISTVALIRVTAVTDNVGTQLEFYTRPAAGSLTQAMTITSSGNVLIGTTTDAGSRLHVVGSSLTNTFRVTDAANYTICMGYEGTGNIGLISTLGSTASLALGTNSTARMRITSGGNVLIGTTTDNGARLQVSVNSNAVLNITNSGQTPIISFRSNGVTDAGKIRVDEAFGGGEMVFSTKTTSGVDTDRMTILANGNVGIGTSSPSSRLHVSGTSSNTESGQIRITNIGQTFQIGYNTSSDYGYLNIYNAGLGYRALAIQPDGGNVLIGTTTDAGSRLQVSGGATFSGFVEASTSSSSIYDFGIRNTGTGNTRLRIGNATSSARLTITLGAAANEFARIGPEGPFPLHLQTNGADRLSIDGSTGAATFSSLGTGTVYSNGGTLTNTNPSDFNLKKNIAPINYGLGEILQLNPVTFNWKNDTINQGKQYGFIAQEVQKIMPDLVKKGEYLGLDKEAIFTTLVKAIQELKQEIDTLKN